MHAILKQSAFNKQNHVQNQEKSMHKKIEEVTNLRHIITKTRAWIVNYLIESRHVM